MERIEQDGRARWAAAGDEVTPESLRERLEEWLDGEKSAPVGVGAEEWELRQVLGVA